MVKSKTKIKTAHDIDFDKLNSRIPNLPKDIDDWVNNTLFENSNYFFTKTEKGIKSGICSHCLTESQIYPINKSEWTCEDYERAGTKHNRYSTCPHCGKQVQFKDNGRGKSKLTNYGYFYILQPVKYGGLVLRTFYCCREWSNVNLFKCNRIPQIEYSEHFRIFMHKNTHACFKRIAYYWGYLHSYWSDMSSIVKPWCHYGNTYASTVFDVATYHPEDWKKIIAKSEYKYSCLDEWSLNPEYAGKYLELYSKYPTLVERLMKQGYKSVIKDKVINRQSAHGIINFNKDTPAEAFKLSKATLNNLGEDLTILDIAKASFLENNKCSEKTAEFVNRLRKQLLIKFKSICKFINPIANCNEICKYLRQQSRTSKSHESVMLSDYYDYIQQIQKLSIPLNLGTAFPPDFIKAHDQTTVMLNKIKAEEECKKLEALDKEFKPQYEKLCKKYAYENEQFIIRPAEGKRELFIEGSTLGHCVYSNYADRYISGSTLIILIRKKDEPDSPFYTLELNPRNNNVIQCQTLHHKSYTENETVSALIKEYLEFLRLSKKEQNKIRQQYTAA